MPLNLKHELKDVDRIDFQLATEQRLIVTQILRGQVGNPQALDYNGFELLLNAGHIVRLQHKSISQSSTSRTGRRMGFRERFSACDFVSLVSRRSHRSSN